MSNSLFRDTAKLVSGTAGGRVILLLALPVVTRLYDPEDFRLLAVFVALVSTISVAACLRFEIAIPLARNDDDAVNLLGLALLSATGVSVVMLALSGIAPESFALWIGVPDIAPYLWLVALGIFLAASYTALQFWATRMHRFGIIARTRVGQAATGAGTMLAMGWAGLAPLGLLLGNMLTLGAGGLSLAAQALRNDRERLRAITRPRLRETLRDYRRYPVFSTPEALANVAGIQIPILIIAAHAGGEAGQLFLAMQVMAAPMTLLGASVGQVYASRAAEELRKGTLGPFTRSMMRRLFLIGVGPIALAALLSPLLFPLIFGSDWERAGWIVTWIAPWMLAQLVVSPVSSAMLLLNKHFVLLLYRCFTVSLRIAAVLVLIHTDFSHLLVEVFSIANVTAYLVLALVVIFFSSRSGSYVR